MKKVETVQPRETQVAPQQVWATLNVLEQKAVLQIVVRICQGMLAKWAKEAKNESTIDP